jgi:hypothetical protein
MGASRGDRNTRLQKRTAASRITQRASSANAVLSTGTIRGSPGRRRPGWYSHRRRWRRSWPCLPEVFVAARLAPRRKSFVPPGIRRQRQENQRTRLWPLRCRPRGRLPGHCCCGCLSSAICLILARLSSEVNLEGQVVRFPWLLHRFGRAETLPSGYHGLCTQARLPPLSPLLSSWAPI